MKFEGIRASSVQEGPTVRTAVPIRCLRGFERWNGYIQASCCCKMEASSQWHSGTTVYVVAFNKKDKI